MYASLRMYQNGNQMLVPAHSSGEAYTFISTGLSSSPGIFQENVTLPPPGTGTVSLPTASLPMPLACCVCSEFSVPGSTKSLSLSMGLDTSQPQPLQFCGLNSTLESQAATSPAMHPCAPALTLTLQSASPPIC
jgi:hypothetical protein